MAGRLDANPTSCVVVLRYRVEGMGVDAVCVCVRVRCHTALGRLPSHRDGWLLLMHCTALHCTVLHCTALHCTALHCTALHCTALHCTASAHVSADVHGSFQYITANTAKADTGLGRFLVISSHVGTAVIHPKQFWQLDAPACMYACMQPAKVATPSCSKIFPSNSVQKRCAVPAMWLTRQKATNLQIKLHL
jgi:hypothetical protein